MKGESGIYRILHAASGKCYVGSTVDTRKRWSRHRSSLRQGHHHSLKLQQAWDSHGADAFIWEMLEVLTGDKRTLEEREAHWIDALRPDYNSTLSVNRHHLGRTMSVETKAKKSLALKGKPWSTDRRAQTALSPRKTRPAQKHVTAAQVVEMREHYATGDVTQRELSARYGIHQATVWEILRGVSWAATPGPILPSGRIKPGPRPRRSADGQTK